MEKLFCLRYLDGKDKYKNRKIMNTAKEESILHSHSVSNTGRIFLREEKYLK